MNTIYNLKLVREAIENKSAVSVVTSPDKAADYLIDNCYKPEDMWRESCWMLTLDSDERITGQFLVSVGSEVCCLIDTTLVVRMALLAGAKGVILSHNHPGGNPVPGQADIKETERLRKALELLRIELCDHIIIGEETFYSFLIDREVKLSRKAA